MATGYRRLPSEVEKAIEEIVLEPTTAVLRLEGSHRRGHKDALKMFRFYSTLEFRQKVT